MAWDLVMRLRVEVVLHPETFRGVWSTKKIKTFKEKRRDKDEEP
jgi:hypothetical protein